MYHQPQTRDNSKVILFQGVSLARWKSGPQAKLAKNNVIGHVFHNYPGIQAVTMPKDPTEGMSHNDTNFQSVLDAHLRDLERWTLAEISAKNIIINRLDSSTRAEEATLVFQKIACVLDDAICGEQLPPHLFSTLRNFAEDLKALKTKSPSKNTQEDHRLLVKISAGQPALSMSPYAVMQQLNNYLEENLVREIQNIKTGLAICSASSNAQEKLYSRINDIEVFLSIQGACKVEKPEIYNAYRLSGVPHAYNDFDGTAMFSTEITEKIFANALTALTNVAPVEVFRT
ncbi:hypothetical protein EV44_g4146 [Erysiphe necator]|uniref:Uncharacterized protein n=1 Tax=Uncinula necator TaxID=52586 RepID=A0A0B1P7V1_UNCNE|nr:hypothetical protein EV44_g4146 [Erysiphe necator]